MTTENKTGCVCPIAQFCQKHNVQKSAHLHKLCQNHQGYFNMWEECRGPGQNPNDCGVAKQPQEEKKEEPIKEEGQALPSNWQMAKNFMKSAATHISTGAKNVTTDLQEKRMSICHECPFFIKDQVRCSKCGCHLLSKTKWESSKCPLNLW